MPAPYEIVVTPLELFVAPYGSAFPEIDEETNEFGAEWVKIGTSGTKSESEAGVTLSHNQTLSSFTSAGSTTKRKVWRTDETVQFALEIADLTPAQYAIALNDATITTVPATSEAPGTKSISLLQGIDVSLFALVARGVSPLGDELVAQYQAASVVQVANPAPKFAPKGGPALLALQFEAIEANAGDYAELIIETEPAS